MSSPLSPPLGTSGREEAEGELARRLAPYLKDRTLLRQALAHRSYCAEVKGVASNERLEFLGDAVLGLVVTDRLYRDWPDKAEGDLARIRSAVVSARALAPVAEGLGVGPALLLGRGESASGGHHKASLLADALEAVIGAVFLASGAPAAERLVLDLLGELITTEAARLELGDAKNRLQELAARLGFEAPRYETSGRGPDHARQFVSTVRLGELAASGEGKSKKEAERLAAEAALLLYATGEPEAG